MTRWFDDLSILRKLLLGFGFVTSVILVGGSIGYLGTTRVARAGDELWAGMQLVEHAGQWEALLERYQKELGRLIVTDDAGERAAIVDRLAAYGRRASEMQAFVEENAEGEAQALADVAVSARAAFLPVAQEILARVAAGDDEEAYALATGRGARLGDAYAAAVQALSDEVLAEAGTLYTGSRETARRAVLLIVVGTGIGIILGLGLARAISLSISRRLDAVAERAEEVRTRCITNLGSALEALARGEVDVVPDHGTDRLAWTARDEIGHLAGTVDGIVDQTEIAIGAFLRTSESVRRLVGETGRLVESAREGRLTERADAGAFRGAYADLVGGINGTLDRVLGPVEEASKVLDRLAERDLSARMEGSYRGDHARIKTALNRAAENLDEAMGEVEAAARQVAAASSRISSGSQGLAQGVNEQAASIEEISASLQDLRGMADTNASGAREATGIGQEAGRLAADGVGRMGELSQAIQRIKRSSDETTKIVGTIDEIASQTNLLALNAAVEAARAGDAGKGFAVVAEEVRALAMRSAEAARTTASLIEEAVGHAESGVTLNEAVSAQLGEIDRGVRRLGEVIDGIAAASDRQTRSVGEIDGGIERLNAVTQQTAANAQESASTSEELSGQAALLERMVGSFTLSRGGPGAARPVDGGARVGRGVGAPGHGPAAAATNGHAAGWEMDDPRPASRAGIPVR